VNNELEGTERKLGKLRSTRDISRVASARRASKYQQQTAISTGLALRVRASGYDLYGENDSPFSEKARKKKLLIYFYAVCFFSKQ
jgi:hypothetical protein